MQAAQGVTGKRKFALAALLTFLLFAAFLATAQSARADTGSSDPNTAGEVAAPPAQDSSIPQQAADQSTPQPTTDQQSTTDQAADAAATAVQPQQSNVVIIIRINSPGDDVVTQTNVVSVVADAHNQSSTSQNSGLAGQPPAGTDPNGGTSNPNTSAGGQSTGGEPTDSQPTGGQAAPVPGPAPTRSQPAQAPVQGASGAQQPVETAAQAAPAAPQPPDAMRVLASTASSTANRAAPESQQGSPTLSATPLRRGGARGRSDASASRTPAEAQMAVMAARPTPKIKAGGATASTKLHAPKTTTIAGKGATEGWLNRMRLAPPAQVSETGAGSNRNLGLTTLAALLFGLIGWRVLTWFSAHGSPWRRAGG